MWMITKNGENTLLCRTRESLDHALELFRERNEAVEVVETWTHVLPDPMEC